MSRQFTDYRLNLYLISFCLLFAAGCASKKRVAENTRNDSHSYRDAPRLSYNTQADKVIATARSYTGTPYRWGGTGRTGMDCSGLLVTSFIAGDMQLPRTTAEQVKVGRNVGLYDLQPGDLVFFAAKKNNPLKITHVGLVTEVKGKHDVQFIHASTKLGVVENNIYADYYRKIFIKARRVF